MTRLIFVVSVWSVWCTGAVSAQEPGQGPIRASLSREAKRLTSTLVAHNQAVDSAAGLQKAATQIGRSDDRSAVKQLGDGTRVIVTTGLARGIRGRISVVTEDTLEMVDRQGGAQMQRREDVREVRLDHRFGVGQYVGLGLLVGGVAGLAIGHAIECDCELRGLGKAMGAIGGTLGGAMAGWMIGGAVHATPGRLVYRRADP